MTTRILHIVTYMGRGGLETMLMNYYRHINREKVQFDFLVHRDFEADYDSEILQLGGKIYHMSRLIPWSRKYKKELKQFFLKHPEYKIVHVHQDCLSSVALGCAKECGVPVRIAHSHNSSQDKNLKYLIKKYYMKKIPVYATDLFACSKSAGNWMFGKNKYHILYNAIDIEKYKYESKESIRLKDKLGLKNELVIGHVGRFNPQKNHTFLIDVYYECLKKNQNIKLLLIGDGDGKEAIKRKVKKLGIEDKVLFMGVRNDVEKFLQIMDIFVFPSCYEGLGIVAVEAQAAGLPCVISDTIPNDCIVTQQLVKKESLDVPLSKWVNDIFKYSKLERRDHSKEVSIAGYDIENEAKKLERYYLRKAGKVK
ncbi:glycosyltransferase family 1 protein [Anaerostipes hadrus]|uniref:glycosyltransferase family 1 protein n=1 Tax=Anaerostipes hadrus TaxID=649756 RepID=UPI001570B22F|nr:glycosyltransferase family 1 protein [Anaerostipes hadrus]